MAIGFGGAVDSVLEYAGTDERRLDAYGSGIICYYCCHYYLLSATRFDEYSVTQN